MKRESHCILHDLDWTVCFVDQKDPRMSDGEEAYFGLTLFDECKILVRKDLPRVLIERTLRHELTHATLFSYGFETSCFNEESICNFIETHGPDILQQAQNLLEESVVQPCVSGTLSSHRVN